LNCLSLNTPLRGAGSPPGGRDFKNLQIIHTPSSHGRRGKGGRGKKNWKKKKDS